MQPTIAELVDRPLWWQSAGLYNGRSELPSSHVVRLQGEKRLRRVYVRILGNAGTAFVVVRGARYVVSDFPAVGDVLRPWHAWNEHNGKTPAGNHSLAVSSLSLNDSAAPSV